MNEQVHNRAIAAAIRCLEMKGYEVLVSHWIGSTGQQIDIVAYDRETLVFIDVAACNKDDGAFTAEHTPHRLMELAAMDYLTSYDQADGCVIRFDEIQLAVFDDSQRALLRHHVGAYGLGE